MFSYIKKYWKSIHYNWCNFWSRRNWGPKFLQRWGIVYLQSKHRTRALWTLMCAHNRVGSRFLGHYFKWNTEHLYQSLPLPCETLGPDHGHVKHSAQTTTMGFELENRCNLDGWWFSSALMNERCRCVFWTDETIVFGTLTLILKFLQEMTNICAKTWSRWWVLFGIYQEIMDFAEFAILM